MACALRHRQLTSTRGTRAPGTRRSGRPGVHEVDGVGATEYVRHAGGPRSDEVVQLDDDDAPQQRGRLMGDPARLRSLRRSSPARGCPRAIRATRGRTRRVADELGLTVRFGPFARRGTSSWRSTRRTLPTACREAAGTYEQELHPAIERALDAGFERSSTSPPPTATTRSAWRCGRRPRASMPSRPTKGPRAVPRDGARTGWRIGSSASASATQSPGSRRASSSDRSSWATRAQWWARRRWRLSPTWRSCRSSPSTTRASISASPRVRVSTFPDPATSGRRKFQTKSRCESSASTFSTGCATAGVHAPTAWPVSG